MSENVTFSVEVFSPRWGHGDTYIIVLSDRGMKIAGVQKTAVCSKQDDGDCAWTGSSDMNDMQPLVAILENDHIYPPSAFMMALKSAWKAWLDRRLDDTQVQGKITSLFEWLNIVSKSKPNSKFWIGIL